MRANPNPPMPSAATQDARAAIVELALASSAEDQRHYHAIVDRLFLIDDEIAEAEAK